MAQDSFEIAAIQERMIKRAMANFGSSTLSNEEAALTQSALLRMTDKYSKVMNQRGGYNNVLAEMVAYIANDRIGDPSSSGKDKSKRQGKDNVDKTALRALLDPAEGLRGFSNILHSGADLAARFPVPFRDASGKVKQKSIHYREVLAYYWLSATDTAALRESFPNESETALKEMSELDKTLIVSTIAEIRLAHDSDYGIGSKEDHPSCAPGTIGRLAKLGFSNPIARMVPQDSITINYEVEAIGFIKAEINKVSPDVIRAIKTLNNFLYGDAFGLTPEEVTKLENETPAIKEAKNIYETFHQNLKTRSEVFWNNISSSYGRMSLTDTQKKQAIGYFQAVVEKMAVDKLGNQFTLSAAERIPPDISASMEEKYNTLMKNEIKSKILKDAEESLKQEWGTIGDKLTKEFEQLNHEMNETDVAQLTNGELATREQAFTERYNQIITRWQQFKNDQQAATQTKFNAALEEIGISTDEFIDPWVMPYASNIEKEFEGATQAKYETNRIVFCSHLHTERANRLEALLTKFVSQDRQEQNTIVIKLEELENHIEIASDNIESTPLNTLKKLEDELASLKTPVDKSFSEFCLSNNLNILPDELATIRQKDPASKKLIELTTRIENIFVIHEARSTLSSLTQKTYASIAEECKKLAEGKPAKGSIQEKQFNTLSNALTKLAEVDAEYTGQGGKGIKTLANIVEMAEKYGTVVNKLISKGTNDGLKFPSAIRKVWEACKLGFSTVINYVLGSSNKKSLMAIAMPLSEKGVEKDIVGKSMVFTNINKLKALMPEKDEQIKAEGQKPQL